MNGRPGARIWLELLALLVRLYPRDFRDSLGSEVLEAAENGLIRASRQGKAAQLRFLTRTTWGMLRNLPGAWMDDTAATGREGGAPATAATGFVKDLFHAVRRMRRTPWLSLYSVGGLALGLGVFGALFSTVQGILWQPLPWDDPDELAWIWRVYPSLDLDRGYLGGPEVLELQERPELLDGLVLFRSGSMGLGGGDGTPPLRIDALLTSPNLFEVLGVEPALGRGFRPEDALENAAPVAILSHDLWMSRFGSDPAALGATVLVEGGAVEVVGVLAEGIRVQHHQFSGPPTTGDLLLPLSVDLAAQNPFRGFLGGLVRVRDGVSHERLTEELNALAGALDASVFDNSDVGLRFTDLHDDLVRPVEPALLAILAGSVFLLMAMTASLAAVIMGQASGRSGEFAVRKALGASRLRAARGLWLESLVIVMTGSVGAVLVGKAFLGLLIRIAPADLPRMASLQLSIPVIAAAGVVIGIVAVVVGAGSTLRVDLGLGAGLAGRRVLGPASGRRVLVGLQLAVSVVLLAGVGLLARSVQDLLAVDPGFGPTGVTTFQVPLPEDRWPDAEARRPIERQLVERFQSLPGVSDAGSGTDLPLDGGAAFQTVVSFPGAPGNVGEEDADTPLMDFLAVTPGYLEAVGARLVQGRTPTWEDDVGTPGVALISAETARRFFPGVSAVDRQLVAEADTLRIVGVVEQLRLYDVAEEGWGQVLRPLAQTTRPGDMYALRSDRSPGEIATALRSIVSEIDPELPLERLRPLQAYLDDALAERRLTLRLLMGFGLAAVLVAALGIYGVVSAQVNARRREVGVRLALGADPTRVLGLILRDGLGFALLGILVGLLVSAFAGRALESLLFGVTPADPLILGSVAALVLGVALAATALPANRAARADPAEALRRE